MARPMILTCEVEGLPHRFALCEGRQYVGRLPSLEIVLDMTGVSKRHAVIVRNRGTVSIEDLASKNGTFVNGRRIERGALSAGDRLQIGPVALRVEEGADHDDELAIPLSAIPLSEEAEGVLPAGAGATTTLSSLGPKANLLGPPSGLVLPEGHVRCESPSMAALYRQLAAVAPSELPVLILGETGVGKEGIARILHLSSNRREQTFVALNCAAIPTELLEAELFGIRAGVATGVRRREGRFQEADGGTLFLDEVGEMPPALQAKLLRALQEKEIHPVGGSPFRIDVRVVSATNDDLVRRAGSEDFRSDLYYRLAGLVVEVAPLRRRLEDIPILVGHFLRSACAEAGKSLRGLSVGALEELVRRPWPGNVRQLEHEVRRLVYLCPDHHVLHRDLVVSLSNSHEPLAAEPCRVAEPPEPAPAALPAEDLDLAALERRAVDRALERSGGNRSEAARLLGISRKALQRRLARYRDTAE